jgi:hypothetical protein
MVEDSRGLMVSGKLDLDHGPSVAVWKAMKSGRITAFSFAFAVLEEHRRGDKVNVLTELDVLDVTITPSPANRNARLVSVKAQPRSINRAALKAFVALGKEMLRVAANDSKLWRGAWTDFISVGQRDPEIDRINARLDDLEKTKITNRPDPSEVDRFITQVREEMVKESFDRAEQARWEQAMAASARAMADITPEDEAAREAEYRVREAADRAHRDAVNAAEVDAEDRADEARQQAAREDPNVLAL